MASDTDWSDTACFGWQGIEINVPATWELGAYGGNFDGGYACLDDGVGVRLRLQWSRRKSGGPQVQAAVRRYRRSLRKGSKAQIRFELLDVSLLPMSFRQGKEISPFCWTAAEAAYGLAWYCRHCRTAVLAEVLFPRDAVDQKAARRLLASACDHRADGRTRWSVYGFAFECPTSYHLTQPDLASGRLQFTLRESRRSWLKVERWGVASAWLRKAPLHRWPAELLASMGLTLHDGLQQNEELVNEAPGVRFKGAIARRGPFHPIPLEGLLWHCPEKDKVYVVLSAGGGEGLLDEVTATVRSA